MLSITLISVGTIRDNNLLALALDYQKRLTPYARLQIKEIKASSFTADKASHLKAKAQEEERLLKVLESYSHHKIYLLSETGSLYNSHEFSKLLSKGPVVLVIAGALGWSADFLKRYPQISLSPMTMTHELAQVVLWEQLYRAATIIKGKTYHY